ncbi:MAG TPA: hypothetical protein VM936_03000 [Pyrinomonadaceae bacterium]|jgi:hypothetical protein|nr:hypothetical protein [Pyrinomonadaceae bacterium]
MHGLDLHESSAARAAVDPAAEVERLEALLEGRRAELSALQEEFRAFKSRYAEAVGGPLAELAEVEQEIRRAEARMLGLDADADEDAPSHFFEPAPAPGKTGLRKLFWSVARMFHPDHASDEGEARRRHTIMAEASRAYRDGDVESLSTLLGDEQLQSYCASSSSREDGPETAAARLVSLKEELVTIEFGLKRLRQDRLYHLMLSSAEESRQGRDQLAQMADAVRRKIVKARNRLANIS